MVLSVVIVSTVVMPVKGISVFFSIIKYAKNVFSFFNDKWVTFTHFIYCAKRLTQFAAFLWYLFI